MEGTGQRSADRTKESERRAQETMGHSDVADPGADNSVTSRMELCIITNLEFNIGKRKPRTTAHQSQG